MLSKFYFRVLEGYRMDDNSFFLLSPLFLAYSLSQNHPVHKGTVPFQKQLDSIAEGKLEVKIFSDGRLGNEREVLELFQISAIAI